MCDIKHNDLLDTKNESKIDVKKWQLVWPNVIFFILVHLGSLYGIYLIITKAKWQTTIFSKYFFLLIS